jgi:hypothetical protein
MLGDGHNDDTRMRAAPCFNVAKKSATYQDLRKEFEVNVFCVENTCRTVRNAFYNTPIPPTQEQKQNKTK